MTEKSAHPARPQTTAEAIAAVSLAVSRIGIDKSNRNQIQKFNFRSVDQVFQTMSPILSDVGLLMLPNVESCETSEIHPRDERKATQHKATIRVRYDLRLASSDPGDVISVTVYAQGLDVSDKAVSKALSAAFKYAVFQTFVVPLEGCVDPDHDSETDGGDAGRSSKMHSPSEVDQRFIKRLEAASNMDELKKVSSDIASEYGIGKSPKILVETFKACRERLS